MDRKRSLDKPENKRPGRKRVKKSQKEMAPVLRLKIQRLKDEDFFISVGEGGLINQLKEEVLRFLKSGASVSVSAEIASIRLIYKGRVLLDAKSIEFYKIKNEDTIQLVPFRPRRSLRASSNEGTEAPAGDIPSNRMRRREGRRIHPITFLSFSTSILENPNRSERSGSRNQELRRASRRRRRNHPAEPRSRSRGPRFLSSLVRFKDVLQATHERVRFDEIRWRRGEINNQAPLVSQLDTLISQATMLRENLFTELRSQRFPARFEDIGGEDGLVSLTSPQPRAEVTEEKKNSTEDERKEDLAPSNGPRPEPRALGFTLVPTRNEEINISDNSRRMPSQIRFIQLGTMSPQMPSSSTNNAARNQRDEGMRILIINPVGRLSGASSPSIDEQGSVTESDTDPNVNGRRRSGNDDQSNSAQQLQSNNRNPNRPNGRQSRREERGNRPRNIFSQLLDRFIN